MGHQAVLPVKEGAAEIAASPLAAPRDDISRAIRQQLRRLLPASLKKTRCRAEICSYASLRLTIRLWDVKSEIAAPLAAPRKDMNGAVQAAGSDDEDGFAMQAIELLLS
jgi:hypothetical protein